MQKSLYFLLLVAMAGCKKSSDDYSGLLLSEIKVNNKIANKFEYDNRLLTRENFYWLCTVPMDEYIYTYNNGRLAKLETTTRSLYSSTATACNPAAGIKREENYEYDNRGRLSRITRQAGYTLFTYNTSDQVIKQVVYLPNGTPANSTLFEYDTRGNITKEIDTQSGISTYEYDNRINPFRLMKQKPGWISAFNTSPNNVIKGTRPLGGFERKITSYRNNLPEKVEENGLEYEYIYK